MKLIKPKFWDENNLSIQSILLYPLTFVIDIINLITFFKKPKKYSNIKTICVGNIYIGGTGKTSLSIKIKKILDEKSIKSCFIKKYYLRVNILTIERICYNGGCSYG